MAGIATGSSTMNSGNPGPMRSSPMAPCLWMSGGSSGHESAGAKVVFGLVNLGYLVPGAFDQVDSMLTPSQFLTDRYRDVLGVDRTPVPAPLEIANVVTTERDPVFIRIVDPSPRKRADVYRPAAGGVVRRPDIATVASF